MTTETKSLVSPATEPRDQRRIRLAQERHARYLRNRAHETARNNAWRERDRERYPELYRLRSARYHAAHRNEIAARKARNWRKKTAVERKLNGQRLLANKAALKPYVIRDLLVAAKLPITPENMADKKLQIQLCRTKHLLSILAAAPMIQP